MKEIFQSKAFWLILAILLLAAFVYSPFMMKSQYTGFVVLREWGWFFSPPKYMEVDLKTLLVEAIIAILLATGICSIPFGKKDKKKE
jgi:ABC-type spermidine/putrescine transport system permease subunit I